MFTTTPALTGTGGVEVSTSGTNYGRQPITSTTGWRGPSGTNREYSNAADITFGVPTANWGTINSCGLWDSETGRNLMAIFTQATP
ncbi:phage tail fiber protein, partial [Pseudomonas syringae]|uniref:phage tail fiber protein n=1 Tax=Pseudomonas syringae TaxID=317 RepID=UPI003F68547E